ncbi:MAG: M1 family aminopeptidase, partial [candidate division WOR-3 bacterium]
NAPDYHALGEFYGEFASYDVWLTLPAEFVVGATGSPVGRSLLTSTQRLHFRADSVRDFAFVADPRYRVIRDSVVLEFREGNHRQVSIEVLVRPENAQLWQQVPVFARRALEHWSRYYGPYGYDRLVIADAQISAGAGMEYPGLVLISTRGFPGTRFFEQAVVHEVGHQWFYAMLGSDELNEAWLDEGINTYAEMRYFEETYGAVGNLSDYPDWLRFLPKLSCRQYHEYIYHVLAARGLLRPVLTPAYEFVTEPQAYVATAYSQSALVIRMLHDLVGDTAFDQIMAEYCRRFRFRHPRTRYCTRIAEEKTGPELGWVFGQWLRQVGTCDYAFGGLVRADSGWYVRILQKGNIRMPVEVAAEARDGSRTKVSFDSDSGEAVAFFPIQGRLRSVTIDPGRRLLEVNRWNNSWPSRVRIRPILDFPSLDCYDLFYGPFLWWDRFHGVQIGPWLMGREFLDLGPLPGRHSWTVSSIYSTRIRDWELGGAYATPLEAINPRLRISCSGSFSRRVQTQARAQLQYGLGRVFGPPAAEIMLCYQFRAIRDTSWLYKGDWVAGRDAQVELSARSAHESRLARGRRTARFSLGSRRIGGDSSFFKGSVEFKEYWRLTRQAGLNVRLFGGGASSSLPSQEKFYLSGSLRPTEAEPINWSYGDDIAGSQENWHIEGDANLRGFVGEHLKGSYALGLNLGLRLPVPIVSPFFDIGNVSESMSDLRPNTLKMDAGVRLAKGPFYVEFPVWRYWPGVNERRVALRWAVGFTLVGFGLDT